MGLSSSVNYTETIISQNDIGTLGNTDGKVNKATIERYEMLVERGVREQNGCYRCGICCSGRPQVTDRDINRISKRLGLGPDEFSLDDNMHGYGAKMFKLVYHPKLEGYYCYFLEPQDDGTTSCSLQEYKPTICKHSYCHDVRKTQGLIKQLIDEFAIFFSI
jgi:hypothetical protein